MLGRCEDSHTDVAGVANQKLPRGGEIFGCTGGRGYRVRANFGRGSQAIGPVIEDVIGGEREDVESGRLDTPDALGVRVEVGTRLWNGRKPPDERTLEVRDA